jgi:ankyrin repeat protein
MSIEKNRTTLVALLMLLLGNVAIAENELKFTAKEQAEIDKFVKQYGNDVKKADRYYSDTLLHYAIKYEENVAITKYLVSQGADVNAKNRFDETPLYLAASRENIDVAKYLVSKGANVHEKARDDKTPLHGAASLNKGAKIVEFLVSQGADVHAKNNDDKTPLHLATSADGFLFINHHRFLSRGEGSIGIVKFLIAQGADVHAKDKDGNTPLHRVSGDVNIAKFLVSKGANVNAKNKRGSTPLHETARDESIVKFLVSQGADIKSRDGIGTTPLHWVAYYDNVEAVKYLVSQGANINAKTNGGATPLDWAKVCNDKENDDIEDTPRTVNRRTPFFANLATPLRSLRLRNFTARNAKNTQREKTVIEYLSSKGATSTLAGQEQAGIDLFLAAHGTDVKRWMIKAGRCFIERWSLRNTMETMK